MFPPDDPEAPPEAGVVFGVETVPESVDGVALVVDGAETVVALATFDIAEVLPIESVDLIAK